MGKQAASESSLSDFLNYTRWFKLQVLLPQFQKLSESLQSIYSTLDENDAINE